MSSEQDRLAEYLRLDSIESRLRNWDECFGALDRASAQRAVEKTMRRLDAELAERQREHDVDINDLKRWLTRRASVVNDADKRVAITRKARMEKEAATDARTKRREMLTEASAESLAKKARKDADPMLQLAIMLDIFVQQGLASPGYRKRAIDQQFDLARINSDIASGKAR